MPTRIQDFSTAVVGPVVAITPGPANPAAAGGNSGFDQVVASGVGAVNVINTDSFHPFVMECSQSSTTSSTCFALFKNFTGSPTTAAFIGYVELPTLPSSGNQPIFRSFDNQGTAARWISVTVNSANKLVVMLSASDTVVYTSTSALTAGVLYRWELSATMGNASNAIVNFKYYVGESTTSVDAGCAITNGNTGVGTAILDARFGKVTGSTVVFSVRYWRVGVNLGSLTFIGPAATAAFTLANTGSAISVNGTGSVPSGGGTITSYDWDWGDNSTHGTGSTATHTYDNPATYVVTLIVTDSNGSTGSITHSVTCVEFDFIAEGGDSVQLDNTGTWVQSSGATVTITTNAFTAPRSLSSQNLVFLRGTAPTQDRSIVTIPHESFGALNSSGVWVPAPRFAL